LAKILVETVSGKVTLVGSSLGGLVALKVYEGIPEKIQRLVLVGSSPKFAKSDDYPYGLDVAQFRKLGGQLDQAYPEMVDIFFRSLFTKYERSTRRYKWLQKFRRYDEKPMKQALMEYLDILEHVDLRELLSTVNLPMQFVFGTDDEICRNEIVGYIHKVQPKAQYEYFDKCGHFPFLSKPYEFNKVLEEFLKSPYAS
jgi:pimeloyl-[acyl-carrier protein] methyl ester esterase